MRKSVFMPVLLALLVAGLCLTQLTGCAEKGETVPTVPDVAQDEPAVVPDPEPDAVPEPVEPAVPDSVDPADGPLTEEELNYFNEVFFSGSYHMNLHNQFLSSVYDTPADIDLYELFYCGTGWDETMEDEEWAAFEAAGGFTEIDVTKVSAGNADTALLENTGLTLEETNKVHLDYFTYLPDYDAYYLAHGDTNYRMSVPISAGERKDGLICLYYDDEFFGDGWKCVTLRERGDGEYHFVSNSYCDPSAVPNR